MVETRPLNDTEAAGFQAERQWLEDFLQRACFENGSRDMIAKRVEPGDVINMTERYHEVITALEKQMAADGIAVGNEM